jgi:hypothetical protein
MAKYVKKYWGRMFFALLLVPAAAGFLLVLINCIRGFSLSYLPFVLGIAAYTLVYPVFKKPLLSYVVGHELTHVIGIWLFRGRIFGFKATRYGGTVKTNMSNVWIALLPYFFPIYSMLVLSLYFLFSILWDLSRFFNIVVFLLGITWAFHLWMSAYILRQNQPDIKESGIIFSSVVVFTVNVIILSLFLVFISPDITIKEFLRQSFLEVQGCYLWMLRHLI